ncbi:MAG: sigma-70 family RNA polymerase sigma factor [Holophagae bacterium]|jgi:RNA polymerase sigma-70 factor (ECF subfamily)
MDFNEVYERFKTPVWRLSRRLTRDDEEALDTTQEIFLRVWKGLPGFREEARISTWVFQIAWNYLRGYRRKKGRQLQVVIDALERAPAKEEEIRDTAPDPERTATSREQFGRLEQAFAELPEHYRVVVWLRDGEDLSYQQMADVLDVPIGTVRSRLARARDALRTMVER